MFRRVKAHGRKEARAGADDWPGAPEEAAAAQPELPVERYGRPTPRLSRLDPCGREDPQSTSHGEGRRKLGASEGEAAPKRGRPAGQDARTEPAASPERPGGGTVAVPGIGAPKEARLATLISLQSELLEKFNDPLFQLSLCGILSSADPRSRAYHEKLCKLLHAAWAEVLPKYGFPSGQDGKAAVAIALGEFHEDAEVSMLAQLIDEALYVSEQPMVKDTKDLSKKQILSICRAQVAAFQKPGFQSRLQQERRQRQHGPKAPSADSSLSGHGGCGDLVLDEQRPILNAFGLEANERGAHSLLHQVAQHIMDPEVAAYATAINGLLGLDTSESRRSIERAMQISVEDPCPALALETWQTEAGRRRFKVLVAMQSELYKRCCDLLFQLCLQGIYDSKDSQSLANTQKLCKLLHEVWAQVLPKYGFPAGQEGRAAMAIALGEFDGNQTLSKWTKLIDAALDPPMQSSKRWVLSICRALVAAFQTPRFQAKPMQGRLRSPKGPAASGADRGLSSSLVLDELQRIFRSSGLEPASREAAHSWLQQLLLHIMDPEVAAYATAINTLLGLDRSECESFIERAKEELKSSGTQPSGGLQGHRLSVRLGGGASAEDGCGNAPTLLPSSKHRERLPLGLFSAGCAFAEDGCGKTLLPSSKR